jgi:uncharacterized RDD family membrane protein YckC
MVSPDWNLAHKPQTPDVSFVPAESTLANSMLARPTDRAAAVMIDLFVILTPIYVLLSAPLKKWMTLSILVGPEAETASAVVSMAFMAIFLIVAYQTVCHFFFRSTVGKFLFDLRVVPMFPNHPLTLWDCFVRSWVWCAECLCLGLPFFSVFSNGNRRPWHDRLCDTVVITTKNSGVVAPAKWEQALVKSFFAFFLAVGGLAIVAQIQANIDKIKSDARLAALVERDSDACEVVSKNMPEAEEDTESKPHARLELAMTLYAAGLADRSCLESEVEREVALQVPIGPVTYLSQAFVYADEGDISNSYLDEVCEEAPGTVECAMSQVVSQWSEEDWEAVEESLAKAPRGSGYLEVWGIRHFMKQARYDKALALLNSLLAQPYLAEFSLVQRVKALYNSYRVPEAEAALLQAVSALPESDGKNLSAWVCAQQLQGGCDALDGVACQHVGKIKEQTTEIDFEESNEALARVLALECRNDGKIDYLSFAEAVHNQDWQTFFRANLKQQKNDKDASAHLFSQLLFSSEAPEILKIEAARRWASFANREQIEDLFEQWRVIDSKETWVKSGNFIFRRMTETGNHDLALKVARYLLNSESLSPQALAVLTGMVEQKSKPGRMPAAVKVRDQVKQLLDEVEGEN